MTKYLSFIFIFLFACSSLPVKTVSDFKEAGKEVDKIKVTSEADQVRKDHIKNSLKQCLQLEANYEKLQTAYEKLQKEYNKISEKAGAGKLVYTVIYSALAIAGIFLILKIIKKFAIF
jgi:hypothetical protein